METTKMETTKMETKKIYEENAYQMDFDAIVKTCVEYKEKTGKICYQIELDQTCFFPEGGGQKGDRGLINEVVVFDTQVKEGVIAHYTETAMEIGSSVYGQVDWKQRHSYMQHHTGEHILSGLIYRSYGYQNVGFHLSANTVTVDVDHELNQFQIEELEKAANRIIWENLPVEISFPLQEELDELFYRSKKEINGQIRIVSIPNVDTCACCAPHVKHTGEVGALCISRWEKYKGGVRLELICGDKALESHRKVLNIVSNLSVSLSAKIETIEEAVKKLLLEKSNDQEKLVDLQKALMQERAKDIVSEDGQIIVFEQGMDSSMQKAYLNLLMKKEAKIWSVFVGSDEQGYRYQIASESVDLKEVEEKLKHLFSAKGGGSSKGIQGSVIAKKTDLELFLKKI